MDLGDLDTSGSRHAQLRVRDSFNRVGLAAMARDRQTTQLLALPLLARLTASEREILAQSCVFRTFRSGAHIQSENAAAHDLGVVLSGRALVYLRNGQGREVCLLYLQAGHCFNEQNIFHKQRKSYTVVANTVTELAIIPRRTVYELAEGNFDFVKSLIQLHVQRQQYFVDCLRDTLLERADRRILLFLSRLAGATGDETSGGVLLSELPSHQVIADHCGLARETVSRLLARLQQANLLKRTKFGWLVVLDAAMSNGSGGE